MRTEDVRQTMDWERSRRLVWDVTGALTARQKASDVLPLITAHLIPTIILSSESYLFLSIVLIPTIEVCYLSSIEEILDVSLETRQDLITSRPPLLPVEIPEQILQPQWKRCEDINTWNDMANVMISCSLPSRTLYAIARANLYNDIRLPSQLKSLRLFLCTVRENFCGHCPAHALHFMHGPSCWKDENVKKYATLAQEIVTCCTALRYLEADRFPLRFTCGTFIPEYPHLKKLEVIGPVQFLPPLLHRIRNLKSFDAMVAATSWDATCRLASNF
ncbi:hypothetical protein K503DRAFT_560269 [Rhizopogon vinicolor AM-OR11-026]|uniref:Uncharacterized protein n=1 Tax=Rhizopogon vinicolor AM-OR11-026 TaxID=1314800 RepID=A0A1B7MKA0_9AGAM|nr:hypothetical protein K503DRAFT_560269 [Rhizopogon vinicolor AM-OR11-026]